MPWRNGQLVEAVDCYACNSSLEWEGDLPDDEADVLCHYCEADKLRARILELESAIGSCSGSCLNVLMGGATPVQSATEGRKT